MEAAAEPLLGALVDLHCNAVTLACESASAQSRIGRALQLLPMVSRAMREAALADPSIVWLVGYQLHLDYDHRSYCPTKCFLYDLMPSGIAILDGDCIFSTMDSSTRRSILYKMYMNIHDKHSDAKLELDASTATIVIIRAQMARFLQDCRIRPRPGEDVAAMQVVPPGVPLIVRKFFEFVRLLEMVCREDNDGTLCARVPCGRNGCTRQARPGQDHVEEERQWQFHSFHDPDKWFLNNSVGYWEDVVASVTTRDMRYVRSDVRDTSFCCKCCEQQARDEWVREVRAVDKARLEPTVVLRGDREPSAARLLKAVLARNARVARIYRTAPAAELRHVRFPAGEDLQACAWNERTIIGHALNVDLGLLFAASLIDQLPSRERCRRVRIRTADFRDNTKLLKRASHVVAAIYKGNTRWPAPVPIVTSPFSEATWMRKIKDRVLEIF